MLKITIIIQSNHLRSTVSQEVTLLATLHTLCSIFDDPYVLVGKWRLGLVSSWPEVTEPLLRFVLVDARGSQAPAAPCLSSLDKPEGAGCSLETS